MLEFILVLVLGGLVGVAIDRLWTHANRLTASVRKQRHWAAVNRGHKKIDDLVGRLEIAQTGWSADGTFLEDHIEIALDRSYKIPDDVRAEILEPQRTQWEKDRFKDDIQCGVGELKIVRTSEDSLGPRHAIYITAHTYRYFESKATHFEWFNGNSRQLLNKYFAGARHDGHAKEMPTPLSVGLSLLCENGKTLILTRRTVSEAAGGHIAGGKIFNAVGENCAPVDSFGALNDRTRISVFRTALRGLQQEMGLDLRQLESPPLLHTFCWDREVLDYKFFGYVVSPLASLEVKNLWRRAPDKSENRELVDHRIDDREAVRSLVRDMLNKSEVWSHEARQCTIMSLLHARRLSMSDLIALGHTR